MDIQKAELIDISGRTIRTFNHINSGQITIPRGNIQSGIYFLRIYADDVYTEKIMIK